MASEKAASDADLKVRPATVDDVPLIRQFIGKLADYERLTHEAVCTDEDLREPALEFYKALGAQSMSD